MSFDWQKVTESKEAYRRKLAAKPIAEKLRMLDALRERALVLRQARGTGSVVREEASTCGVGKETNNEQ